MSTLWSPRQTPKDWKKMFDGSKTVHFYQTSSKNDEKIFWPEAYKDKKYPAYVPLALEHCPMTYFSDDMF